MNSNTTITIPSLLSLCEKELRWVSLANEVKIYENKEEADRLIHLFSTQIENAIRSEPKNGWQLNIPFLNCSPTDLLADVIKKLETEISTGFDCETKTDTANYQYKLFVWHKRRGKPTTFAGYQLSLYSTSDFKRVTPVDIFRLRNIYQ